MSGLTDKIPTNFVKFLFIRFLKMASYGIGSPWGIAGVIFLILALLILAFVVYLMIRDSGIAKPWYTWVLLGVGILLLLLAGIMFAIAFYNRPATVVVTTTTPMVTACPMQTVITPPQVPTVAPAPVCAQPTVVQQPTYQVATVPTLTTTPTGPVSVSGGAAPVSTFNGTPQQMVTYLIAQPAASTPGNLATATAQQGVAAGSYQVLIPR